MFCRSRSLGIIEPEGPRRSTPPQRHGKYLSGLPHFLSHHRLGLGLEKEELDGVCLHCIATPSSAVPARRTGPAGSFTVLGLGSEARVQAVGG